MANDKKGGKLQLSTQAVIPLEAIKAAYIAEGKSESAIAKEFRLSLKQVKSLVEKRQLAPLRQAFIKEGLKKIQNKQLDQAEKLMQIELDFKRLKIIQLEDKLKDFVAYYTKYGDFYKRHPASTEILHDMDGLPLQISVPSVSRELNQLKESVTLSEGVKKLLSQIDDIINPPLPGVDDDDDITIDMKDIDGLFKKRV